MDIRYNSDNDTYERVEPLPPDAVEQQIAAWQKEIDFHNGEIQKLNAQIASIGSVALQRTDFLAAKLSAGLDTKPQI